MKKTFYMAPAIEVSTLVEETSILQSSISEITEIGGNSGIGLGDGETPATGDSRFFLFADED